MTQPVDLDRRDLGRRLGTLLGAVSLAAALPRSGRAAAVAGEHGRIVPPLPVPALPVTCADGRRRDLNALLQGRTTVLQLMYTGCTTVCPIQGAIFQRLQSLLPADGASTVQLLSLSIAPLADTPAALRDWLAKFNAGPRWLAVAPQVQDLGRLTDLFGQGRNAVESHTTQVNIVDPQARLVWRSPPLPSPDAIAAVLRSA
jgi:protein SCO1/2